MAYINDRDNCSLHDMGAAGSTEKHVHQKNKLHKIATKYAHLSTIIPTTCTQVSHTPSVAFGSIYTRTLKAVVMVLNFTYMYVQQLKSNSRRDLHIKGIESADTVLYRYIQA